MKQYRFKSLVIMSLAAISLFAANDKKSILSIKESITDNDIVFSASFWTDTNAMMENWYLQNYAILDKDVENKSTGEVDEAEYIRRLKAIPSSIELPYNQVVRSYIDRYVKRNRTLVEQMLGMSLYYMPIFEQALEKEGLPLELRYIPVIESAMNPNAVSPAGAAGLWQFMLGTARGVGLEVNSLVDERRDPYRSSEKAATYFKQLHDIYGDWSLAIAAYNCGPGNVNKAIRRSGKRDFWSVYEYLPRETRGYVPAFVGAMYAIHYSKEYGIVPNSVQLPVQVDTFMINKNLHLQQVSELVGIPFDELKGLNPQYIKDIIPGNSKPYVLRIPYNYTSAFLANEDSLYTYRAEEFLNPQTLVSSKPSTSESSSTGSRISYKVRSGDSLGKIASRHHVTVAQLKSWNHLRSNTIRVGQRLYIYKGGNPAVSSSTSQPKTSAPAASTSSGGTTYKVKKGDTLYKISKQFGVSSSAIMKYNGIGESIREGQVIKIPSK